MLTHIKFHWVFDVDSVITANPESIKWWIYHLRKNGHKIEIVTSRNPKRIKETKLELIFWGIKYDGIYFMPKKLKRDFTTQAKWKVKIIKLLKPDIWVDNNFKIYERALGVNTEVEGVCRIEV